MLQLIALGSNVKFASRGTSPEAKATGTIAQKPTSMESIRRRVTELFGGVDVKLIMIAQNEF